MRIISVVAALLVVAMPTGARALTADLVLLGGRVWTIDPERPEAEAVAVWQGRILEVGDAAQVRRLIGPQTRVLELPGRLILPGFFDNHVHFLEGGFWLAGVKLKDAADPEEFGRRLADFAVDLPGGEWITGGTWDHDRWPGGELPTAALIDRFVPDVPVLVSRYDGHMAVANSLALRLAGVTAETDDPAGGVIVRQPGSRQPAGVLKDSAQALVQRVVPPRNEEQIRRALLAGFAEARRVGVTSLTDMNLDAVTLRLYQELHREGELTARIDGRWPLLRWRELAGIGLLRGFAAEGWIQVGGLKGMIDGSLGSSTALFFDAYEQDPSTSGIYVTPLDELRRAVIDAHRAGLHPAVHAIGDRAIAETLDVFAEALGDGDPAAARFRIEHSQHVAPDDFARFARLGVVASVQPYHAIDDGRWAEGRIGRERCETTYAFRSFLDAGVRLAFGSHWTVAPLDPILGIAAAVDRRTTDGANPGGWFPEQKISVGEAIEAYTLGSAYAAFDDDVKGSITPGKLADIVVLSHDLLEIPSGQIGEASVLYTIVDGRIVHEAEGARD